MLINCIECGNKISDKSSECIKCGAPTSSSLSNDTPTAKPSEQKNTANVNTKDITSAEINQSIDKQEENILKQANVKRFKPPKKIIILFAFLLVIYLVAVNIYNYDSWWKSDYSKALEYRMRAEDLEITKDYCDAYFAYALAANHYQKSKYRDTNREYQRMINKYNETKRKCEKPLHPRG